MRYAIHTNCVVCILDYNADWRAERQRYAAYLKPVVPDGHRLCSSCRQILPVASFPRNKAERHKCKACWRAYKAAYYASHPEVVVKQRETAAARKLHDWMGRLLQGSRSSAKLRGLEHNFSLADIAALWEAQAGRCHWLGIPMMPSVRLRHPLQPSLDRLDTSRGYVQGNVVLTTLLTNLGRTDTSPNDFAEVVATIKRGLSD